MKGIDALQKSYNKQKEIFENARRTRVSNRVKQIEEIEEKISRLMSTKATLVKQNLSEEEFESFESFRLRAEKQKNTKEDNKKKI